MEQPELDKLIAKRLSNRERFYYLSAKIEKYQKEKQLLSTEFELLSIRIEKLRGI